MNANVTKEKITEKRVESTATCSSPMDEQENSAQPLLAKSAEDRKAAAALSSIDDKSREEIGTSSSRHDIDHEAVRKAMERLSGVGSRAASGTEKGTTSRKGETNSNNADVSNPVKSTKVNAADVALIVEELELSKVKATQLLKSFGGDIKKTLRTYIQKA
ncbi:hypothetical protein GcC1_043001 [Golovinomyces cichoracearum]|uniref:Nascent polypeptide-associated complex subunit alpha-like UBA domain-containing protein n=1 Tax=Golovinomyces cichoracearum TaxID=62708 RepID=A0A420IYY3_9PEZI|nr:hypothetical protein GcC1_043001 [Golovinomyces cichoracearum]